MSVEDTCPRCGGFRTLVPVSAPSWVWADGTIYDPQLGGYRDATPDEISRNVCACEPQENTE